ncbi:MAG: helix-turn-helix domain-containing protein [Hyphomicrobiales bacterium]
MAAPTFEAVFHGIKMRPGEEAVAKILWARQGALVAYDTIIDQLWQLDPNGGPEYSQGIVKVWVCFLRKKVPNGMTIETVWGRGYRLEVVQ